MTFGDFPVGLIQMMKNKSLLLLLRTYTDDHVAWLRSVHIILMMAPTFSSSALIVAITSHWLWLSFDYNYSVFDYTHLRFAKPRWPYADAIDYYE